MVSDGGTLVVTGDGADAEAARKSSWSLLSTPGGAVRALAAVVWIWYAVVLAVGLPADAHFVIYGFAGGALVVLATYPNLPTVIALIAGGCLLLSLHPAPLAEALSKEPGLPLAYVGLAAVIYVAIRSLRAPVPSGLLVGAVGLPSFIFLLEPVHTLIISLTPQTLDPVLHRIDVAIFGEVTFASGRLLASHTWLRWPAAWCYVALGFVGSGVYVLALQGRTGKVRPAELIFTWAVAAAIGVIGYLLVPAVGPRYVFPEWPWQMPDASGTYAVPLVAAPRNAMPSLHATWALLICWGAREAPVWMKWLLGPWLALTLFATVAGGGHYLIDVIPALPLTLVAAWAGARLAQARFMGLNPVAAPRPPAAWLPGG